MKTIPLCFRSLNVTYPSPSAIPRPGMAISYWPSCSGKEQRRWSISTSPCPEQGRRRRRSMFSLVLSPSLFSTCSVFICVKRNQQLEFACLSCNFEREREREGVAVYIIRRTHYELLLPTNVCPCRPPLEVTMAMTLVRRLRPRPLHLGQ